MQKTAKNETNKCDRVIQSMTRTVWGIGAGMLASALSC